jgi:hypothetical protein
VTQSVDDDEIGPPTVGYNFLRVADRHALVVGGVDHQRVDIQAGELGSKVERREQRRDGEHDRDERQRRGCFS